MFWQPDIAVDVLWFASSPGRSSGAPTAAELLVGARAERRAGDGRHVLWRDGTQLWIVGSAGPNDGLAAVVPFGPAFDRRSRALARFDRIMRGKAPSRADGPSPTARALFTLRLRALDANLDGASHREIAMALFGTERVPAGPTWKSHDLRSHTLRLVGQARALMNTGYLKLLR